MKVTKDDLYIHAACENMKHPSVLWLFSVDSWLDFAKVCSIFPFFPFVTGEAHFMTSKICDFLNYYFKTKKPSILKKLDIYLSHF